MTSVLITGGLGFIGSNLARKCLELGHDVVIYDNLDPNSGGKLYNIAPFKDKIKLVIGDITNYQHLVQELIDVDFIVNCAASSSHPYSMREPSFNLDVNGRGVINILEAIKKVNPSASFVHVGTTTQFGTLHYIPADELHPEFPSDIYSANKSVSEKYVLIYAKAFGLKASVVRLPNVYGPRAAIHSPEFTFNNYFIGLALQNKSITVYKPGSQLRNILYVEDAVNSLVAAMYSQKSIGQTFIASGDHHFSVMEIASKTSSVIGGSVLAIEWPKERSSIEIGDAVFSNKKIKQVLDWSPLIDFETGLDLTMSYYNGNLKYYL